MKIQLTIHIITHEVDGFDFTAEVNRLSGGYSVDKIRCKSPEWKEQTYTMQTLLKKRLVEEVMAYFKNPKTDQL